MIWDFEVIHIISIWTASVGLQGTERVSSLPLIYSHSNGMKYLLDE